MAIEAAQIKRKDLSEDYYLANFMKVVSFVKRTYCDILMQADLRFIGAFERLPKNSQLLFVRLSLRSKSLFCQSKLNYSEIDLSAAIEDLEGSGFIECNPALYFEDYTSVLTVLELLSLAKELKLKVPKSPRAKVLDALRPMDEALFDLLVQREVLILVNYADVVEKILFLFFGSRNEDISHFILEDIGIRRYQKIKISHESRLFKSRRHVKVALELGELHENLWLALQDADSEDFVDEAYEWLMALKCPSELKNKWSRSLNMLAKYYEKKSEFNLAESLYKKSSLPPARERLARISDRREDYESALHICQKILKKPNSVEEKSFAEFFIEQLKRKKGLDYKKRRKSPTLVETKLDLKWDKQVGVEQQVLLHLERNCRARGFFSENHYWKALTALLFWDQFWQSGDGVFFHPFESMPRDFLSGGFFLREREAIEKQRQKWLKCRNFPSVLNQLFCQKMNTHCELISWNMLEQENFKLLLTHTPVEVCLAIALQILKEPREYRRGLPDLFLVKDGKYLLGEVKSPNDQIQQSQKRWFNFFSEHQISYQIFRVL